MKKMYNTLRLLFVLMLGSQLGANAQTSTYGSSGAFTYTVPAGVTGITVTAKGAQGGLNSDEIDYPDRRGYGGIVTAYISVTPGQVLAVNVGGCGGNGTASAGGAGGFNGGGDGSYGVSIYSGGGGGGASDVRLATNALTDRLVVAGGGGGAGIQSGGDCDRGGDGGATIVSTGGEISPAGCGIGTGGGGGIYGAGGALGGICGGCGGTPGNAGNDAVGGSGGTSTPSGGGGGGYGAGGGGAWTGGGGGSNWYNGIGVTMQSQSRGTNASCGSVSITTTCRVGIISGSNQVCEGVTNPALTETVTGGTWSSSNTFVASVGTTGAVTGVNAGTVTITYSLSTLCYAVFPMTVNAAPSSISGLPVLCVNQTVTLTDPTPLGTWSTSDASVATVVPGTGLVTGIGAGLCNISFTITATGCNTDVPFVVNAIPAPIVGPDTVCAGSSITLTDDSTGGTWTNVGTHASIVGAGTSATVTGINSGTDVISYTYPSTGCAAKITVTVHPLPSGIGGPAFICMGQPAAETDITTGGTWTIIPGTGSANIGSSSGMVTPLSVGTVTVVYTLPTSCSVTRTISINPSPAAISPSSVQVCQGSTAIVTDPTTGGTWSSASGGVASIVGAGTTGTITGVAVAGGTAVISYLVGTCAATIVVTVNPKPTAITGPTEVCEGDCSQVYGSGPGAGTWTSSTPATGTIDGTTGTFCAIAPGTTTLTYTFTSTGCQRSLVVTVNPIPIVTASTLKVCIGYTTTLDATPPGGTWATTSSNISLTPGGTATGVSLGTADVTYTATTTCTVIATVTVNPLPNPIVSSADPICIDGTATLTSPGSPGGTWSTSTSFVENIGSATGVITGVGVTGGVGINTYTLPTGCFVTYSETLNSLPTFATPPPAAMCVGTTFTAFGGGGSGNWTSSNTAVATVVTGSGPGPGGTITALTSGTTNLCYTFITAPGTCAICQTMNVVPALTPISGPHQVCTGATITLTSGPGGGVWTSSTGATTVVGAGATCTVTGVTTVGSPSTITYALGTCQVTYDVSVNQSPAAITVTAPNSFNICQGLTTTMCTTGPGPGGYNWSSSNPAVASITSAGLCATATGVSAGTALIDYTSFFNGCFSQATVTVTNGVGVISGPSFVCMGSTALETETSNGNWSSSSGIATVTGGAPGPMVNNSTITPVSPGVFTLTFLSITGCTATKSMTVDALPSNTVIPLGSTNLCPGGSVELTASTGTGYTYQWGSPGAIGGATNATYVAGAAGNYIVTVTGAGPCSITSAATPVTMNPVIATVSPFVATTACASAGLTLTASAATTYQWLLGGVAIPGAVASTYVPTITGSYSVQETNTFGCVGTSGSVAITLAPSPAGVVTISGSLTLCAGQSVTLTSDAGSGYTYQWYNGGLGSPIPGATNISYTTTTAGNYFVVDVNSTGCSTTSATSVVVVNPLPTATITAATSTIFCAGGSVSLAAPASATNQFQWYKNGVLIAGATTATYVAGTTGNYTVTVINPVTGCMATSAPKSVTEVFAPVINLITSSSFCWGSSADLAAIVTSGSGTVGYQWQLGGTNIPGATNNTYPATVSGNYSVEIFVAGGLCNETSAAVAVTEKPLPNPLVTDTLPNVITQRYFVTYQWYLDNILIPGATNFYTTIIGNGTYKVKVTDTNGCQSVSAGFPISGWVPSAISNINIGGLIKIYPNPAQDALHIDAPIAVRAVICGMDGRTLINQSSATEVNISPLANGIYTIRLYDINGNQVKVDKFVKESN